LRNGHFAVSDCPFANVGKAVNLFVITIKDEPIIKREPDYA